MASYAKRVGVVRALQSPTGVPDIRLSLHDERYGLCHSLPGDRYAHRRWVNALRLVIRLDAFVFTLLDTHW